MPYDPYKPKYQMFTPGDLQRLIDKQNQPAEPPRRPRRDQTPEQELAARLRLQRVLNDVIHERERQDAKWGPQDHHPLEWLSILGEEYGEVCQAANKAYWGGRVWADYREELIQVAAVAVAMVENLDQQGPPR